MRLQHTVAIEEPIVGLHDVTKVGSYTCKLKVYGSRCRYEIVSLKRLMVLVIEST